MHTLRILVTALVLVLTSAVAARDDDGARFFTTRGGRTIELPAAEDGFVFAVFGDRTGGPADGVRVLADAVRDVNLLDPDLVMTVGDLVEGYNEREPWLRQMREFRGIMDGLAMPWYPVAGNHDVYWRGADRPDDEHEGDYERHFGPLWYAFEHKDCWFIVLYSDEPDPVTGERNFNKPASQVMSPTQRAFLAEALERSSDARHVFVFLHHPRWLGGQYGDDWKTVHAMLAAAGNVRAVFAGHIHSMRHDGVRDGIEYVTLATVGGVQTGSAPRAGWLHQYHLVTVRDDGIELAALPVGEVMDVRAITGDVAIETHRVVRARPAFDGRVRVALDGGVERTVRVSFTNPVERPIEIEAVPVSDDPRWRFEPAQRHAVVEPGATQVFAFRIGRRVAPLDETFRDPAVELRIDYLAESARFPLPDRRVPMPMVLDLPAPPTPVRDRAVSFDGRRAHLRVPSDLLEVPDGPLTLECWFEARSFGARTGLVTKTESSEYGFFVSHGAPEFFVFLGDAYVTAKADGVTLETGRGYHLAGVFDGREVRLYLDGALVGRAPGRGARRPNDLPLIVGADVDGNGRAVSHFDGLIDAVRLSTVARYAGERVAPPSRPEADAATALLLNFDGPVLRWAYDGSGHGAHPTLEGGPRYVDR